MASPFQQPQWRSGLTRQRANTGEIFAELPGEVLELILDALKEIHLGSRSNSCATCWMRDACSMAVTARKMLKYARAALYEDIQLVGLDSPLQRKRFKPPLQHGTRLVLLRRTLRSNPQIAAIVRQLKVPNPAVMGSSSSSSGSAWNKEEYENIVASVIMACPNLERVVGFYPTYQPATFQRYVHALSTRQRLKEMTWIIEAALPDEKEAHAPKQRKRARSQSRIRSRAKSLSLAIGPLTPSQDDFAAMPGTPGLPGTPGMPGTPGTPGMSPTTTNNGEPMTPSSPSVSVFPGLFSSPFRVGTPPPQPLPAQTTLGPQHSPRFYDLHVSWQYLTTLTVHGRPGATLPPDDTLLVEVVTSLPALHTLRLSHLPLTSFSDASLLGLPPLRKLTLAHLPGISSEGLSSFAARRSSRPLESLALIHVSLDSLQALARLLAKLPQLTSLSLVQCHPPTLTPGEVIWLFPYLASASLRQLHWDLPTYANHANAADMVLARSLATNGFPALRRLRAPADPDGILQMQCQPQLRADLPEDRWAADGDDDDADAERPAKARQGSTASCIPTPDKMYSNLKEARAAAQQRIEAARDVPRFVISIADENGAPVEQHPVGGFVGTVHSLIKYHLVPEAGASDDKGGLVDMDDLLADGGEAVGGSHERHGRDGPDVCTGRWNADWEQPQKKDRERWWHTERGRWKGVTLS